MTTLHEKLDGSNAKQSQPTMKIASDGADRRQHRRHDMHQQGIAVDRWDNKRRVGKSFGEIVDISAGGVRIRTRGDQDVKPDGQIRIRLELPDYAGISPFLDNTAPTLPEARVGRLDGGGTGEQIGRRPGHRRPPGRHGRNRPRHAGPLPLNAAAGCLSSTSLSIERPAPKCSTHPARVFY